MAATVTVDFNANLTRFTNSVDRLTNDLSKFQTNSDRIAGNVSKAFSRSFTEINSAFSLLGSGLDKLSQMASGIMSFVGDATKAQDEMGKMAQKAGIGVEALSGLSYAAKLAGADTQTLVASSKKLSENILESARAASGSSTMFSSLGIAVKDSGGKLRETDQIMLDVAGKFAGMKDGADKSRMAVQLFGKSGLEMIPFLNQGKDGIQALTKEAEKLGLVISKDAAAASERFNDNLDRLSMAGEGLKRSIGNNALPVLNFFVQSLTDAGTQGNSLSTSIKEFTSQKNLERWAENGAQVLAFMADAAKGVAVVFQDLGGAIGAGAAAIVQVLKGNFEGAAEINRQWQEDSLKLYDYTSFSEKVTGFFAAYREESAKTKEAVKSDVVAGRVFTAEELKKQDDLRKKYGEAEQIRILGAFEVRKQKLEESARDEIALLDANSRDYASLKYAIEQKLAADIMALQNATAVNGAAGNAAVLASTAVSAQQRVGIETTAAAQVAAVWSQANAAKAGQTGGEIMNRGTPGEFVSNWDASGKYVGDLGKTVSGIGALGNSYSSSGRKLSMHEEISMLNGFARFADGGSFMVGGSGGTDSQLVQFMATPNERVTVSTPGQQAAGGATTINVNVSGGNPQSIIAAIRQALRTEPGMFSTGMARAG
jgi:hypothetical protein